MNLYSKEFIKDTTVVPIRKDIYVYLWRNNKLIEYLAEFRLHDFDIKNLEYNIVKNSASVLIKQVLTEGAQIYQTNLTVATESDVISYNKIWLPERDLKKAIRLFIQDRELRIIEEMDKIKTYSTDISILNKLDLKC